MPRIITIILSIYIDIVAQHSQMHWHQIMNSWSKQIRINTLIFFRLWQYNEKALFGMSLCVENLFYILDELSNVVHKKIEYQNLCCQDWKQVMNDYIWNTWTFITLKKKHKGQYIWHIHFKVLTLYTKCKYN